MKTRIIDEWNIRIDADPFDPGGAFFRVTELTLNEEDIRLFSGHIKSDGCSNWTFNPDECFHACDREQLLRYGQIMQVCYDWAVELRAENQKSRN